MSKHRNPRQRLPKRPPTHNPPPRPSPRALQEMRAAFRDLVRLNPRAASATLDVLQIVANANRSRAMRLVEAVSTVVSSIRGRS
jgi:hypothetical protein